jgi:transcription initiation factor TFIIA large subunit
MRQSGAISGGAVQEPAAIPAPKSGAPQPSPNVHDLNVPYEATEDYEAPEDDMPYPPVSWLDDYFQCSLLWFLCVCDVLM